MSRSGRLANADPATHAAVVLAAFRDDPGATVELAALLRSALSVADGASPPVYTVETLAEATGIPRKTIRAEIRAERLTARKRAGRYVITPEAVLEWAAPVAGARGTRRARPRGARPARGGPLASALARNGIEG